MKKLFFFSILILNHPWSSFTFGQAQDTLLSAEWNFAVETDLYFTDPFIFLPIITADKSNLHLEARYNYEDLKLFQDGLVIIFLVGKILNISSHLCLAVLSVERTESLRGWN